MIKNEHDRFQHALAYLRQSRNLTLFTHGTLVSATVTAYDYRGQAVGQATDETPEGAVVKLYEDISARRVVMLTPDQDDNE